MSDKLRHSAESMVYAIKKWREAAAELQLGINIVPKLELNSMSSAPVQPGVAMGPFDEALNKYKPAPTYFKDRMAEGIVVFNEIADVLEEVLNQYAASDEAFAAEVRRLTGQIEGGA